LPKLPIITVDEEKSQSRARLAICAISLVGFAIIAATQDLQPHTLQQGYATVVGYQLFALLWHAWVVKMPGRFSRRRYLAMSADIGIMVFWMHLGDRYVTSYYPIFLWVIVGNGIRFGPRFLISGIVLGALGFGSLLVFDSYWAENQGLGLGLLLGVVVLPIFFLTVLRRLQIVSRLEVELAKSRLADRAKDQFLAAMSHELRTPMNGVLGMAELLQDSDLTPEQREQVNIITRSVDSLQNIINDILDYSKITAHRLVLESVPFDLHQVLNDVYMLLRSTAESKGIDLIFQYPADAHTGFTGDPTRIRQLAFNLVGNAIKFTNEGSVTLRCSVATHRNHGHLTLSVIDTGIGIPRERQAAIFDVFEQVDNSVTRKYGGSGLGLAISRQLAELMDGEISVKSEVGHGSTFTVRLRLETSDVVRTDKPAEPGELPRYGLKALIVEDNPFNQMVTRKTLTKLGIDADIAENGAVALEMLDASLYDLVFMDIRMPVMDGYEATRQIRARGDATATIPVLAITAEATEKARAQCLEAGMDGYLAKPVRIDKIVAAVDACLAGPPAPHAPDTPVPETVGAP
jgi:two-component system sensor histidine kinase RpfC